MYRCKLRSAPATVIAIAGFAIFPTIAAADSRESFTFSPDPAISAQQHAVYDVVHRYEELLNAGDTAGIVDLFAPDGVAEWNDKPTFVTRQEKIEAYNCWRCAGRDARWAFR
jgi:hypothetical protein